MTALLKNNPFFVDKAIASCKLLDNQGYCNENYLLIADGKKYIVRKLLRDDIDRAFEWSVHNLAFKEKITAEPLLFDKDNALMVFAWIKGLHKTTLDKSELAILAQTLRKLHSIHIDAQPIKLQTESAIVDHYPKEYVLCHNDLNPQNIFFAKDVKFIDWEYAGVNDRYFDLACVCVEFNLDVHMQEVFLDAYFDCAYSMKKLEAYKVIYKALCEEWFENNKL